MNLDINWADLQNIEDVTWFLLADYNKRNRLREEPLSKNKDMMIWENLSLSRLRDREFKKSTVKNICSGEKAKCVAGQPFAQGKIRKLAGGTWKALWGD